LKPKIAIVGGSGFIGKSLAEHFSKTFQVEILDIREPLEPLRNGVGYVHCDVTNYQEVVDGLAEVDLVIHTVIVQIPLINEQKSLGYKVNVIGTQNTCSAVENNQRIKGMILAGTWHTIGEKDLKGVINEEFGFRPDKVEDRARLYALSKMAQEAIVRYHDEMSTKIYGVLRMGTVLGEGMPRDTAANIFIERGLRGEPITPFKHSMYRPMLYVDVGDICRAYEAYAFNILNGKLEKSGNSAGHTVNVYYPQPITIFELAEITKRVITKCTNGQLTPKVEILDKGIAPLFEEDDIKRIKVDIDKARSLLGLEKLKSPMESLTEIVTSRLRRARY
jgi:nucleoside-diphosphate-sugar epimerase